ncbi:U3 small nucleolar RNA-associated protein 4 homolog [Petromyzon marinus]|uniref:U3 small nucleolar RNA-associated protein 4 homolog n=1 Tax=Petromyzon marinus TaxID=7757 RepID=UPI003F7063C4
MGEFSVHRVRLFDWVPSAARCLAYCAVTERIAVGRADGSIEIYNAADNFYLERAIPGGSGREPEALCWAGAGRLFGAGLDGAILEYDLQRLRVRSRVDAFGGPVWCMAPDANGSRLAVGCEDGSVKIFTVNIEGIQFEKNLELQKGRVVSIAWHPSGARLATGSLDNIRVFDVNSGHCTQRVVVGRRSGSVVNQETVVWAVAFLTDGTVAGAESSGRLQLWEAEHGTLVRGFTLGQADILSLAVEQDETSMFVGTSDGRVAQLQLLESRVDAAAWVRTKTFKYHTHDVRALVLSGNAVISAGLDAQVVMRPLMEKMDGPSYEAALRRTLFPHRRLVSCAKKAGRLLFQFPRQLELWSLGGTDSRTARGKDGDVLPVTKQPVKLLQLKCKDNENVGCSAVSPCGTWLAYGTTERVRLYRLHESGGEGPLISKVGGLPCAARGAHQLTFSADSSRLLVAGDTGALHVLAIGANRPKLLHSFTPPNGSAEPIQLLAVSEDGEWVATAACDRAVHVYSLSKFRHHCTLPMYGSQPCAIAIAPGTNNVVAVHADHQVFEFGVREKQYTEWSRRQRNAGLPANWQRRDTPVTHIAFHPGRAELLLLHDAYRLVVISTEETMASMKECKKYQPLLYLDVLHGGNSLVVVERPLTFIQAHLPPAVRQKKFGT